MNILKKIFSRGGKKKIELVFVSGAYGKLGNAILLSMGQEVNRICYGLQRHSNAVVTLKPQGASPVEWWPCDVADFLSTTSLIQELIERNEDVVSKVTLVHAIGPFKYEGYKKPDETGEVDPEIMKMNYDAFVNMTEAILSAVKKIDYPVQVNLCTFGSVSEEYNVPLWYSFNQAKQKVRDYIEFKVNHCKNVSGLYVRTSTIDTGSENKLRPHARDEIKRYWLDPEKVASLTCDSIKGLKPGIFRKQGIICLSPDFNPAAYYSDIQKLDTHWRSMMPKPS